MVPPLRCKLKFIFLAILLLSAIRYPLSAADILGPQYVRVAIIEDASSLMLRVNGPYTVASPKNGNILSRGNNLNTTVTAYKEGILIGCIRPKADHLVIKAGESGTILINGRVFRGDIELIKKENMHLLVINDIGLEDYVKGISVR